MADRMVGKRYEIIAELGTGSMGVVFRALDRLTGQHVALKQVIIPADKLNYTSRSVGSDPHLTLAQEFRILASLRHPNIISVLDYGFDEARQPYVTMELLDHAITVLEAGEGQPLQTRLDLLVQMLQALTYLHRRGALHRDLKPSNVMVEDGVVKVLDFGLSVMSEQAPAGEVAGTPNYMAPELWFGDAATKQSDLYAFGVIAYRLVSGQLPYNASSIQRLYQEVQNKAPDLTPLGDNEMLKFVIGKLLSKDPAERLSDAGRVMMMFNQASNQKFTTETAATRESFLQAASFVGRERELAQLTIMLNQIMSGPGSAVLLAGESGVGKSRLLDELRTRSLVNGALVLRGQAISEGSSPYDLWRDAIRWLIVLANPDDRQASILKTLVPDIAKLLNRTTVPDAPEVAPQAAYTRLLLAIEGLFQTVQQPTLLILEDLHWADNESLTVLARVIGLTTHLPLLIVGSYRGDETPNLPVLLPGAAVIPLNRLTVEETGQLAEAMLGSVGRNANLLKLLQHETEGNAFFLVEVVRALAEESGQLAEIGSSPLPPRVLTGGVQGVVQRRLNRVPPAARPLLQVAAVAGRQLDMAVIREVMGKENAPYLDHWLSDCSDAAVLEVQEGHWRFAHNKLRDGVLSELHPPLLNDLHRQVALGIEATSLYSAKQTAAVLGLSLAHGAGCRARGAFRRCRRGAGASQQRLAGRAGLPGARPRTSGSGRKHETQTGIAQAAVGRRHPRSRSGGRGRSPVQRKSGTLPRSRLPLGHRRDSESHRDARRRKAGLSPRRRCPHRSPANFDGSPRIAGRRDLAGGDGGAVGESRRQNRCPRICDAGAQSPRL